MKPGQKRKREPHAETPDLYEEINNLKDLIQQVNAKANAGTPLEELLKIVDMVGLTSVRRANLLKVQKQFDSSGDLVEALNTALEEIVVQFRQDKTGPAAN
jgi:hypothetical protein